MQPNTINLPAFYRPDTEDMQIICAILALPSLMLVSYNNGHHVRKMYLQRCAASEDLHQPKHKSSLIRVLAVGSLDPCLANNDRTTSGDLLMGT